MIRSRFFTVLLFFGVLTLGMASSAAQAQSTGQYTLTRSTYRQVLQLQKLLGASKYKNMIEMGKSMLPRVGKESPYAEALVSQLIANAYLLQKKFNLAEPYLETIVRLNALQPAPQKSSVQELATLYLVNKNYNGAIRLYKQVLAQDAKNKIQPGPKLYYRLGLAYSYRGGAHSSNADYSTALHYIKRAIDMAQRLHRKAPKKNDAPRKEWYESWFIMTYKLKNFAQSRAVAKLLVAKWPQDKNFWNYYANTALLLHDDVQAAAIYGLMYKRGMLKNKDDYLQLASLLLEEKTPYQAARVIAAGMVKGIIPKTKDNYNTLSQAWTAARAWDKALVALGQEAKLASDGKVFLRQAQIYLNRRDYIKAQQAAQNALDKGGMGEVTGSAWMALGEAAFEIKNYRGAVKAFHQAAQYKSQARNARSWLDYVASTTHRGG